MARLREAARFARREMPALDQPMDRVSEGLLQRAGLQLQLVPGLRVVAAGVAVEDPDALATPGQSRSKSALCHVCRPAERREKPRREGEEPDATSAEVAERADDAGHRQVAPGDQVAAGPAARFH